LLRLLTEKLRDINGLASAWPIPPPGSNHQPEIPEQDQGLSPPPPG